MGADFIFKAAVEAAGNEQSPYAFVGVASSTRVDRQDERITEKGLTSMASQVPMVLSAADSHAAAIINPMAEVGTITTIKAEDGSLYISGALDPKHPNSEFLYTKIQEGKAKLSIAGKVVEARKSVWDGESSKYVSEIDALELDHILLCRSGAAVNQDTAMVAQASAEDWMGVIFKAAADVMVEDTPAEKAGWPADASMDEITRVVGDALRVAYGDTTWVVALYGDYVICDADGKYLRIPYTYADGACELGEPEEVKQEWVAAAMVGDLFDESTPLLLSRMDTILSAVQKVTGDTSIRERAVKILVEDLLKADYEPRELPDNEGTRMSDLIDGLVARLEQVVKGEAPAETPPETSAEPETVEVEKTEEPPIPVLDLLQEVVGALKSIDERIGALEKAAEAPVEEPPAEDPPAEPVDDSAKAEEPPAEDHPAEISIPDALKTLVMAVQELQGEVGGLKDTLDASATRLDALEKASPVSTQVRPTPTDPADNSAGGSPHPIHDLVGRYLGR